MMIMRFQWKSTKNTILIQLRFFSHYFIVSHKFSLYSIFFIALEAIVPLSGTQFIHTLVITILACRYYQFEHENQLHSQLRFSMKNKLFGIP